MAYIDSSTKLYGQVNGCCAVSNTIEIDELQVLHSMCKIEPLILAASDDFIKRSWLHVLRMAI